MLDSRSLPPYTPCPSSRMLNSRTTPLHTHLHAFPQQPHVKQQVPRTVLVQLHRADMGEGGQQGQCVATTTGCSISHGQGQRQE